MPETLKPESLPQVRPNLTNTGHAGAYVRPHTPLPAIERPLFQELSDYQENLPDITTSTLPNPPPTLRRSPRI